MKKQYLVDQTLASANAALTAVQSGQTPDVSSFMKWTENLLRHVFYSIPNHSFGQYLEDLSIEFHRIESVGESPDKAIKILTDFIAELHVLTDGKDLDSNIEFEVPFDQEGYYPAPSN